MLREWILCLVYAIRFIPGTKNYADLLTKPLPLEPFKRFRDAVLGAQMIFPDPSPLVSANYVSRITQYLLHALSLPEPDG